MIFQELISMIIFVLKISKDKLLGERYRKFLLSNGQDIMR